MNPISNHTTVSSSTPAPTVATTSKDPSPISDNLRTDLEELKTLLNRLNNEKDPGLRTKLKEEFNNVLDKYCNDAGPAQDQLNLDLQEAGLIIVGNHPYLQPSSNVSSALDDSGDMDFVKQYVLPDIDTILGQ